MEVAVILMMILHWGWSRASVVAKNTWWALAASYAVMATLGSVPVTLWAASVRAFCLAPVLT